MKRIASIDITRGIVMIIMALDHVREFMHVTALTQSPADLETTTPILFFTRWITHLCAPSFVFLAGTSAYLSFKKRNNISLSRSFLLKRGAYLILLEFIVVNFALYFDTAFHTVLFEVIAAIGFGFIFLALVLKSSAGTIAITGLLIIFCHNLVPFIPLEENSTARMILNLFFSQTAFPLSPARVFVMAYPPVPWLGIMLVGFASGKLFEWPVEKRKQVFFKISFLALVLFFAIRLLNFYGDPLPWSHQQNAVFTFLSFINVTKYPPSLQFCLITLGLMFLILALSERSENRISQVISVYGRVPLFYFVIHLFLIHILMLGLMFLQGFTRDQMDFASGTFGRPDNIQSGVPLWIVYGIWVGVVLMLYKPCLWFGNYKSLHTYRWLKYI